MTVPGGRFEPMTTGVLLDRALQFYTANFALMLGVTAVAYVPFYVLMLVVESALGFNAESGGLTAALYFAAFIIFWSSVAYPIAGGAATYAISERYLGNEVTIAEALRRSLACFWRLSLAELAATLRVLVGFLLLIVPGVLWTLSYALIVPVILIEDLKAMPSLARSRDLMSGHRGKAFCIMIVPLTLQSVVSLGLGMIADWIFPGEAGENTLLGSALDGFLSILFTPFYMLSRAFAPEPRSLAEAPMPGR
jgi:hypothetical protein